MGSLQRNASWLFTFVLGFSAPVIGAGMPAQTTSPDRAGPAKGAFDWKKFAGKYDFGECQSHASAIWGGTPGTFVQIDHKIDHTRNHAAQGLELMRVNARNPIALGWSIERVGLDRLSEIDVDTGRVGKVIESYATVDGVYAMIAWDRPYNVGWSTLQLRMDAQDNISFTMRQRTDSDSSTREETCTLRR